jgi:predicted aspartyl protease
MGKNNDCYALTLFDNEGTLKHIVFDIHLSITYPSRITGNVTINTINNWKVTAMIDTGATISGITSRMVKRMGLNSHGEYSFIHAKGKGTSPVYFFDVVFPKNKVFENIEAIEINDEHNVDFVIGMNIISQGDMALTSVNGKSAFSFRVPPAEKYIDFELLNS